MHAHQRTVRIGLAAVSLAALILCPVSTAALVSTHPA
jgi:hypothetical protein